MRKTWRCFHCDEVFRSAKWAAEHFGQDLTQEAACKIKGHEGHLLTALRKAEEELTRYRQDDSDLMRAMYSLEAEHRTAVVRAEEEGYARGVRDMKKEGFVCT